MHTTNVLENSDALAARARARLANESREKVLRAVPGELRERLDPRQPISSDLDAMADTLASELDKLDTPVIPAVPLAGLSVQSFADKFVNAIKQARERQERIEGALAALKRNYNTERERLMQALEDTNKVGLSLETAMGVLAGTTVEPEPEAAPKVTKRRQRK